MGKIIALLGSLDTKGAEYAYVRECIHGRGHKTLLIDTGVLDPPTIEPDVTRAEVAAAAGEDLATVAQTRDRGLAVALMARGAEKLLPRLFNEGSFDAVLALGGSGGTSVACRAMRALPLGVPKVMVSTVAGGDVSGYVDISDIVMIPSIVDIAGINRISREVLARAAGAVCGMVETRIETVAAASGEKPLVVASMFGNTTRCIDAAKAILEAAGFEVLVFHATGTGGRAMEQLIRWGGIAGVLDVTTTEWADQLVGGVLAAGEHRLEAAARKGVPAVVAPGCLDMVNFYAPQTVPEQFRGRKLYAHNPDITLMRTTPDECRQLGRIFAEKLNGSAGPVAVLLPLRGWSMIDSPGGPCWWPEADGAFHEALKGTIRSDIPVVELDANINDPEFARCAAETLLQFVAGCK